MKSKATQSDSNSQPLFRPEVMAARGNYHGEVLLVRPLSLTIISWTAIVLVTSIVAFLCLSYYAPVRRVPVSLGLLRSQDDGGIAADVSVPLRDAASLAQGSTLVLLCRSCASAGQSYKIKTTVSEIIPASNRSPDDTGSDLRVKTVVVRLSQDDFNSLFNRTPSTAAKVEAELPLPRQPLYRWLFQPGSQPDRS